MLVLSVAEKLNKIGTPECRVWSQKIFDKHRNVDGYLKSKYIRDARSKGSIYANKNLLSLDQRLTFSKGTSCALYDQEIRDLSVVRAAQCESIFREYASKSDLSDVAAKLSEYCESQGLEFPLVITRNDTSSSIAGKIVSAAKRVCDDRWWVRKLRKMLGCKTESVLRAMGFVQKASSPYISNWAFKRWASGKSRNRKTLARLEAVTTGDDGEEVAIDLLEKVDKSLSNPAVKENELKARVAGYEAVANGLGLVGAMFTLTCPSRFHPYHHFGGRNSNFDGSTPREAADYLNDVWAQVRAEWARRGIKTFGLRTVEPHHDGTPHYHIALLFNAGQRDEAWEVFYEYALRESPDEAGAKEHRATRLDMDPGKGSLMGYVLKYICKNLTGEGIDWDMEAELCSKDGAKRATAWASIWGIRQFQFIGSVSVTVWRELRRVVGPFDDVDKDLLEKLRVAADDGDWALFVELMGGPFVGRKEQPVRPQYSPENPEVQTQYYESVKRLVGLWLRPVAHALGRYVSTRDKVWVIREKSFGVLGAAQPPP